MDWNKLADRALRGDAPGFDDALAVLRAAHDETLAVLDAAYRVRRAAHGNDVRIHVLQNAKSGVCPEDCAFCSQSLSATSGVDRYRMQTVDELVSGARRAHDMRAVKYCIVTATRGPSASELATVCEATRRIKSQMNIKVCTSLGLLSDGQAEQLKAAGVDRFNHNLETSRRRFADVCSTHSYDDRIATVRAAKRAGLEACCGGIVGMGETDEDRVALAFELRELEVESIPVNFLDPRPGTPLADATRPHPLECLRVLCMMRFVNPARDIRVAGGREVNLRRLQPLALYPANSLFVDGYLTTPGDGYASDIRMIEDAGFRVAEVVCG